MNKPLFRWVVPPDGHQRDAKDLIAHCVSIQATFSNLMERRLKKEETAELFDAMAEVMVENGIQVVGPSWFAGLFNQRAKQVA